MKLFILGILTVFILVSCNPELNVKQNTKLPNPEVFKINTYLDENGQVVEYQKLDSNPFGKFELKKEDDKWFKLTYDWKDSNRLKKDSVYIKKSEINDFAKAFQKDIGINYYSSKNISENPQRFTILSGTGSASAGRIIVFDNRFFIKRKDVENALWDFLFQSL